jgi:hypothetical protein
MTINEIVQQFKIQRLPDKRIISSEKEVYAKNRELVKELYNQVILHYEAIDTIKEINSIDEFIETYKKDPLYFYLVQDMVTIRRIGMENYLNNLQTTMNGLRKHLTFQEKSLTSEQKERLLGSYDELMGFILKYRECSH